MARITSAEFQNAFGRYREVAQREAVIITHHGRDSLVLIAADEYQRLKDQDREAFSAWELGKRDLLAIAEAQTPPDAAAFNHEMSRP